MHTHLEVRSQLQVFLFFVFVFVFLLRFSLGLAACIVGWVGSPVSPRDLLCLASPMLGLQADATTSGSVYVSDRIHTQVLKLS